MNAFTWAMTGISVLSSLFMYRIIIGMRKRYEETLRYELALRKTSEEKYRELMNELHAQTFAIPLPEQGVENILIQIRVGEHWLTRDYKKQRDIERFCNEPQPLGRFLRKFANDYPALLLQPEGNEVTAEDGATMRLAKATLPSLEKELEAVKELERQAKQRWGR